MGNCVMKISCKPAALERQVVEEAKLVISSPSSCIRASTSSDESGKRKRVRFKVGEEDGVRKKKGGAAVRIRVVLTQAELNQILMSTPCNHRGSLPDQLGFMTPMNMNINMRRSRRSSYSVTSQARRRTTIDENAAISGWTPALESIPEDH